MTKPAKVGIILYQTPDGQTSLEVKLENETVWLTQAHLFDGLLKGFDQVQEMMGPGVYEQRPKVDFQVKCI